MNKLGPPARQAGRPRHKPAAPAAIKRPPRLPADAAALRRRAEERLEPQFLSSAPEPNPQLLLHELRVHQIELEMQNEELRQTRDELSTALEQYKELYDFAPVGYFVLDAGGGILRANLTGAGLLGIERARLTHRRFGLPVAEGHRSTFEGFLQKVFAGQASEVCEVALLPPGGGPALFVRIKATLAPDGRECRVVVMDITQRWQAEAALQQESALRGILLEHLPCLALLVKNDTREIVYANTPARLAGAVVGRTCYETCFQKRQPCPFCVGPKVWDTRQPGQFESVQGGKCYDARWVPLGDNLYVHYIFDITERKRAEEAVRQLSARLLEMQDEERRRLARELHDTLGQSLVALGINLRLLQQAAPRISDRADELLAESLTLADQCTQEARTSSYLLHPPLLEDLGLVAALRDHAGGIARRAGLRIQLDLAPDLARLPRETELALFRVFQESLLNIQRHSGSKLVRISLTQTPAQIRLEVRDRGRGMMNLLLKPPASPAASGEGLAPAEHPILGLGVGLAGMRERMRQLGGQLEIRSTARGTTILALVPRKEETTGR